MQKHVKIVDLFKSFPTSIYYSLAKFGFDTAENELSKVCRSKMSRYPPPVINLAPRTVLTKTVGVEAEIQETSLSALCANFAAESGNLGVISFVLVRNVIFAKSVN